MNPEGDPTTFKRQAGVGINGSNGIYLNVLRKDMTSFELERRGGASDALITPTYDLSNFNENFYFSFYYACASQANETTQLGEELRVSVSTNCGRSWNELKTISGSELVNINFWPTPYKNAKNIWDKFEVFVPGAFKGKNTKFKIEFIGGEKSNSLLLDGFNMDNIFAGITPNDQDQYALEVFPNPVNSNGQLNLKYVSETSTDLQLRILNTTGQIVHRQSVNAIRGENQHAINLGPKFSNGFYIVELASDKASYREKVYIN